MKDAIFSILFGFTVGASVMVLVIANEIHKLNGRIDAASVRLQSINQKLDTLEGK